MSDEHEMTSVSRQLQPDDLIRVVHGPFAGLDGLVLAVKPESGELTATLMVVGPSEPIVLRASDVRLL